MEVNMKDIARHAGVSVSTVSRVLNGQGYIRQETREKVLRAIEKYHYIPNNSARNLKREAVKAVGIVVKGFSNPFFVRMLDVVQRVLEEKGYLMYLHPIDPLEDEVEEAVSLVKEKKPMGILFLGGNFEHGREKLDLLSVPYVMLAMMMNRDRVEDSRYSSVSIDDYRETYEVGRRVWRAGHRRVAVMGFHERETSVSGLRVSAFQQALWDCGSAEGRIIKADSFSMVAGYSAAKKLLRQEEHITCLFCIADVLALGAMRAIHEAGLRVPEDIAVIGFDGIEAGRFSVPSLATVRQPGEAMAESGVGVLIGCIEQGRQSSHLVFPAEFFEGESFVKLEEPLVL